MSETVTRPIIGIENRTAQEVFDIMCDRFLNQSTRSDPAVRDRVTDEMRAEALRLLQQKDERDDRVQEIIEYLREIVLLMPAASRPDGLMKKAQDAVYGMRGRLRLMDDAALTAALRTSPPEPASGEVLTNSLPFVVQYRRKDDGIRWIDMSAYDCQSVAERYRDKCSGENVPWEYRVEDRSPTPPAKEPQ